jgi:hypothetical protein
MAVTPYHAPKHTGLSFSEFIRKPWVSFEPSRANSIWPASDEGIYLIEQAENILALRSMKIQHWLNLRQRVKHIAFIQFESLCEELSNLEGIVNHFNIPLDNQPLVDETRYLKGGQVLQNPFEPKIYAPIEQRDIEFIKATLDWNLEQWFNYKPADPVDGV